MPSLAVTVSPLADPLSYPGVAVDADYLWLDSWTYEISSLAAELGRAPVTVDGGPLAAGAGQVEWLDAALALAGAAPMSSRHPVVSFGSNCAPAQLRDKFAALDPVSKVIPVVRGRILGLSLSHSPHVSPAGYLPYMLVAGGAAAELPVFVLWLDPLQLAVLNRTEPNYDLVSAPADRYRLTLGADGIVSAYSTFSAYRGKWGALRWPAGAAPFDAGGQQELFARLNEAPWFRALAGPGDVQEQMARFQADAGLRERVRQDFVARGWVTADGWWP